MSPSPISHDYQAFNYISVPEPIIDTNKQNYNRIQLPVSVDEEIQGENNQLRTGRKKPVPSLNFGSIKN